MPSALLTGEFYNRSVVRVATQLLGKRIVRRTAEGITSGIIVETEAYKSSGDSACHASRGRTPRNATMFGPPGLAYVYSIHTRFCLNVVTEAAGKPSAVLIRAIEPTEGIELMHRRRGREKLLELTRGPGRLCEALDVDTRLNGIDLAANRNLWISDEKPLRVKRADIVRSPRVGVSSAQDLLLRFFLRGNPFVSGPRRKYET